MAKKVTPPAPAERAGPKKVKLEENGYIVFEYEHEGKSKETEPLDLYHLHMRLVEIRADAKKLPPEQFSRHFFGEVRAEVEAAGIADASYRVCHQFAEAVFAAVAELGNAGGGGPKPGRGAPG